MSYPLQLTLLTLSFLFFIPVTFAENPSTPNTPPVSIPHIFNFLIEAFNGRVLTGSWHSPGNSRAVFDYFDGNNGFIVIEIIKTSISTSYSTNYYRTQQTALKEIWRNETGPSTAKALSEPLQKDDETWNLMIKIYDGEYIDLKSVTLGYKINKTTKKIAFDGQNSTLSVKEDLIGVQLKAGGIDTLVTKKCLATFSLYFIEKVTMKPWTSDSDNNFLQFRISSPDCGFEIFADNLDNRGYADFDQIVIYTVMMSLIGLFTIIGNLRLEKSFNRKAPAFRISMGTVWLVAMIDYYLLILNVILIFLYSILLIIPCIIYLVLIFYIERRTIFKCLKVRGGRMEEFSDNDYRSCGFYFLALGMLFILEIIFILSFRLWVVHISALVFIPQIVRNVKKKRCYKLNFNLLFLMGIVRVGFVIYGKYYPRNIFRLVPDFQFVAIYCILILLQLFVLVIQTKFPTLGFGFRRKKTNRLLYEDDLCSICMGHLKHPSCDSAGSLIKVRPTIETTCGHVFHMDCLSKWVESRPVCPVCRKNIEETVEEIEFGEVNNNNIVNL